MKLQQAIENIEAEGGTLITKKGWLWAAFAWLVRIVTLNGNKNFSNYYTTIGPYVCQPRFEGLRVDAGRIATLEHERIHLVQMKRWGLGSIWLGLIPFGIAYLLLPLPFGLAYFRYRFEREAYAHGIRVWLDTITESWDGDEVALWYSKRKSQKEKMINHAVEQLTSGAYGYTWPFKRRVRAYFERELWYY